jgi:hypothetical protein
MADSTRLGRTRVGVVSLRVEPVDHRVVALQHDQRHQPLVVRRRGQQVTDTKVARPQPLVPRHPVRCQ